MVRVLHVLHRDIATSRVRHVQRLNSAMNEQGHDCDVCSLAASGQEKQRLRGLVHSSSLADSRFCSQSHVFDAGFFFRFSQRLKDARPDVVHYWGREKNPLLKLANRFLGNRPLATTLDSEPCRVCVPLDRSTSNGGPKNSLRSQLNLHADAKLIATRTDLRLQSRGKDLIWALDCLRVLRKDVFLVFFGDGEYQAQLSEYSEQVNAGKNIVHFVSESETQADTWFAECDLFWDADPVSNVVSIVDAMHFGIPVVAADTPITQSVITDRETGFLVPVADAAEFARRTNILMNDEVLLGKVRSTAQQHVTENFGVPEMTQHYLSMYERRLHDRTNHAA